MKLNAVLRRSSFESDVPALLEFASLRGLEVRFIELMRTGPAAAFAGGEFVSSREVRERLGFEGALEPAGALAGPARRLRVRFRGTESRDGLDRAGLALLLRRLPASQARPARTPAPLPDGPRAVHLLERLEAGEDAALEEDVDRFVAGKRPPLSFETPRSMAAIGG